MLERLRNYSLIVVLIGACIMGFAGPIMYPELMVQSQMGGQIYWQPTPML